MNLLIMGPAGSGKGTMSELIVREYGIPHISSGDMFRSEIAGGTPLGIKAKEYIVQGLLVPDEVTIGMVQNRLSQKDCQSGYLLDGFPRTLAQAKALEELTERMGAPLDAVLVMEIPYELLRQRITGRRICPACGAIYNIYSSPSKKEGVCDACGAALKQRDDDTEEGLKKRLEEFESQTKPVLEYFAGKGLNRKIDASVSKENSWAQIRKILEGVRE